MIYYTKIRTFIIRAIFQLYIQKKRLILNFILQIYTINKKLRL
jgi:hypothetical protein